MQNGALLTVTAADMYRYHWAWKGQTPFSKNVTKYSRTLVSETEQQCYCAAKYMRLGNEPDSELIETIEAPPRRQYFNFLYVRLQSSNWIISPERSRPVGYTFNGKVLTANKN
jgi:hypothetical protein